MKIFEAELIYDGYRRKNFEDWLKVQRICYINAVCNSAKPKSIKPENLVDLSSFDDLMNDKNDNVNDIETDQPKETSEELRLRLAKQVEQRLKMIKGES